MQTENQSKMKVRALLCGMSLEEKLGQMMQLPAIFENADDFIEQYHLGSYLHAVGETVERLNALNRDKSTSAIPLIYGVDAIHGHCFEDEGTVFPVQLASACAWNPSLMRDIGVVTAREAYASGLNWTFSPVLCVGRDPRWGRTSETFGEDPLLIERMAEALVEGYQNAGVPFAACAKHFAAYGETDGARDSVDAHVSERQLRSIFLPPFKAMVDAGCLTFMAGYQALNGIPVSANTWLMNTVLREEWGYEGVVVTDWNNVGQMLLMQNAASDMKEAVALCLEASNDIFMATPEFFDCALALIKEGRVSEKRIDESVERILALKIKLGLFDDEAPKFTRKDTLENEARWALALEAARQSLVLLKNEDAVLPLHPEKIQSVLLVGENARDILAQLGDWSFIPGPQIYDDHLTHRATTVTLEAALKKYCSEQNIRFTYLDACGPLHNDELDQDAILEAAEQVDHVVFCAGDTLIQHGEFHDRASLRLTGNQLAVFESLTKSSTPISSVLLMSKPLIVTEILAHSQAVVLAFNPGAKGGTALVECLFGECNPSGKLPISFPRHEGQLPVYYNQAPGWHATLCSLYEHRESYVDLAPGPLLAFGEGLSYSELVYGDATLSSEQLTANASVTLSLSIENKSARDAVEIVQLYVQQTIPAVTSPTLRLLDFQRVTCKAKTLSQFTFTVHFDQLQYLNKDMEWETPKGKTLLKVGRSSKAEDLQILSLSIS